MASRKSLHRVSRSVPQTDGLHLYHLPEHDLQSGNTKHLQFPGALTDYRTTNSLSSMSSIIPRNCPPCTSTTISDLRKPQLRPSTSYSDISKPRPSTAICGLKKPQPRPSTSLIYPRKPQPRPSTALYNLKKQQPRPSTSHSDPGKLQTLPSTLLKNQKKPLPHPSTSIKDQNEPRPRQSTSTKDQKKPQPHPSTLLKYQKKPQSSVSTSFTIDRTSQNRPYTAIAVSAKPQLRSFTTPALDRRPQSPAQFVSNGGRGQGEESTHEQEREESVRCNIPEIGLVSSLNCDDSPGRVFNKQMATTKMPQKSAKTSRRKNTLKQLNLEDFPNYWYTTVIPATDVYIHRPVSSARAPRSGLRIKSELETSKETDSALTNNAGSQITRPHTSRLLCHFSPVTTTHLTPADLSGNPKLGQYDLLYETALRKQKESCRNLEELLRRKVHEFLVSLDESVKLRPLFQYRN